MIRPAVAATDRAKPQETASPGSRPIRISTEAQRTAGPARRPPVSIPRITSEHITAARITLGCGRTKMTKNTRAAIAMTTRARRRRRSRDVTRSTAAMTIATFPPDTAVRCARPAVRISSSSSGGWRETSPTDRPVTSEAVSGLRPDAASRSPSRIAFAAELTTPGWAMTVSLPD